MSEFYLSDFLKDYETANTILKIVGIVKGIPNYFQSMIVQFTQYEGQCDCSWHNNGLIIQVDVRITSILIS